MSKYSVVSSLTRCGFKFLGAINSLDLDYFELIEGDWFLGVIEAKILLLHSTIR